MRKFSIGSRWCAAAVVCLLFLGAIGGNECGVDYCPVGVPGVPSGVRLYPAGNSSIRIQFQPPANTKSEGNNGLPVSGFKVELSKRINEQQELSIKSVDGPITGGSYKVEFKNIHGTKQTSCLPWNISSDALELALNELENIDSVKVSRSSLGKVSNGYVYTIAFDGKYLVDGDQPNLLKGITAGCTAFLPLNRKVVIESSQTVAGNAAAVPEIWTISTSESTSLKNIGGSFSVSIGFEGSMTKSLGGIVTVKSGSNVVDTTGNSLIGKLNRGDRILLNGEEFTIHMTGVFTDLQVTLSSYHVAGASGVAPIVSSTALGNVIVTKDSAAVTTSVDWSSLISIGEYIQIGGVEFTINNIVTKTITLGQISNSGITQKWTAESNNHITAYRRNKVTVSAEISAADMKSKLESLPEIGEVDVQRVGPTFQNAYVWSITFTSMNSKSSCPSSPCLLADKKTGSTTSLTDIFGAACTTCLVSSLRPKLNLGNIEKFGIPADFKSGIMVKEVNTSIFEVQSIVSSSTANDISGTFAVNFKVTTPATPGINVNFDETSEDFERKLESLPTVGNVNVTRIVVGFGYKWTIHFLSNTGDLPLLKVDGSQLVGNIVATEEVKGQEVPHETVLNGLVSGETYTIRISAKNKKGYGLPTDTVQSKGKGVSPAIIEVSNAPDSPDILKSWPVSSSQVGFIFKIPKNGGNKVSRYQIEFTNDANFGTAEVKAFNIYSTKEKDILGTFRLKFTGYYTPALSIHTTAEELKVALNNLPNLNSISTTRSLYILTGTTNDKVTKFSSATNSLTTTALSMQQALLLTAGSSIWVGTHSFRVQVSSKAGDKKITVQSNHGVADFTADLSVIKVDPTGNELSYKGYQWKITFQGYVGPVPSQTKDGLSIDSQSLYGVEGGTIIKTVSDSVTAGTNPKHYGSYEVSAEKECGSYVVGGPSSTQILRLFADTTITGGRYKLELDGKQTNCINFDAGVANVASATHETSIKAALEKLEHVRYVTVQEFENYKSVLLSGIATSKVVSYDGTSLTVISTDAGGLTSAESARLGVGTKLRVSRNPNNPHSHSCDFTVKTKPAAKAKTIAVNKVGACASFTDSRVIRILDFKDYHIKFWGQYKNREWPTLKVVTSAFGDGVICASWAPVVPVYAKVQSVKSEGSCIKGISESQTIIAEGTSPIGGYFTVSFRGVKSSNLAISTLTATKMKAELDKIVSPATVQVTTAKHGTHSKAWHIVFVGANMDKMDTFIVTDAYLSGLDAVVNVYPTVVFRSNAQKNDIRGDFRISFGKERTEPIAHGATQKKVIAELQKLPSIFRVDLLGISAGSMPLPLVVTATAGQNFVSGIKYQSVLIDPTRYMAAGDQIIIAGGSFIIDKVMVGGLLLTQNYAGSGSPQVASVGSVIRSKIPLGGTVSLKSVINVVAVTKGLKVFTIPSGHGYSTSDKFSINGQYFTVASVTATTITMNEVYTGSSVVASVPVVPIISNKLRTTADLSGKLPVSSKFWLQVGEDKVDEFEVLSISATTIQVKGIFTANVNKGIVFASANGFEWFVVFKSYVGKLNSINAYPENNWSGTDARISTIRPSGSFPYSVTLGTISHIQTVSLFAEAAGNVGTGGSYTLTFQGETTAAILWGSTTVTLKTELEKLSTIDGVSVKSAVLGNGFVHEISFWGVYDVSSIPLLSSKFNVGAGGQASKVSIQHAILRDSSPQSAFYDNYLSLDQNRKYLVRVTAFNSRGRGVQSQIKAISTAGIATLPYSPRGVTLGNFYGRDWLSVEYLPPRYDGGASINKYRLEWDSSDAFSSNSPDYGFHIVEQKYEIQQIVSSFNSGNNRGGTFTLSWGGLTTTPLSHACSSSEMASALKIITGSINVGQNPIQITRSALSWGYSWMITFTSNLGDLALLRADRSMMLGDNPRVRVFEHTKGVKDIAVGDFTYEIQEVYSEASSTLTGTFKLAFEGKITNSISVDASALEMQVALQALSSIYSVKVSKQIRDSSINTAIWTVTFGHLNHEVVQGAGNIHLLIVKDTTSLNGLQANIHVAEKVKGTNPYRHSIEKLKTGKMYYFRAMAYNVQGFGSVSSPLSSSTPRTHPNPPSSASLSVNDFTSLKVAWTSSVSNGGSPVDKYKIEWFRKAGVMDEQTITTSAEKGVLEIQQVTNFADSLSLGGHFKLKFQGETTLNIAWNAPATGAGSVKERLERLSTIGTIDVSKTDSVSAVYGLLVTVSGKTATKHSSSVVSPDKTNLKSGDKIWIAGQAFTIDGAPSSTTITLLTSFSGTATLPIIVYQKAFGYNWKITFIAGHVGKQSLITAQPSDNWAGVNPGIWTEVIREGLQPISGTFRLSMTSVGVTHTTHPLKYDISALGMKKALEELSTIGIVNVTRTANGYGFNWLVSFVTDFKNDISLLSADGGGLTGPSAKINVASTLSGVMPLGYCEKNGVPGSCPIISASSPLSYIIPHLTTGSAYTVRIRAHNSEGWGSAYTLPNSQTPKTVPGKPTAVELIVMSDKMLKIKWAKPSSNGGSTVLKYRIEWDTSSTFANTLSPNFDYYNNFLVSSSMSSPYYYNIPVGITANYFVRIFAINDEGKGLAAYTTPSSATPAQQPPGSPEKIELSVLSNYGLLVKWAQPSINSVTYGGNGGLPISQYMVEWDTSSSFDSPASYHLLSGTVTSYIIGGHNVLTGEKSSALKPGTTYFIRLSAFNSLGAGPVAVSSPKFATTANKLPSRPLNLVASIASSSSVKAQWDNPLYDGGETLTSYNLHWDIQEDFSSGNSTVSTIPVVREMQSISASSDPINEEQFIEATVQVVNERQTVRSSVTGVDEIQVVQTSNAAVKDEVQTVTSSATDRNEIQEIQVTGDDVNEIQAVRTGITEVLEQQRVEVGAKRVDEIQTLTVTFSATSDINTVLGSLYLRFDNSLCTFCSLSKGAQTTAKIDLRHSTLTSTTDNGRGVGIEYALDSLSNIDNVVVTRSTSTGGGSLTAVFSITFRGDAVAGDVPTITVPSSTLKNSASTAAIVPSVATELTKGNEPSDSSSSTFTLTYSCEEYPDPTTLTGLSTNCASETSRCTNCVTALSGTSVSVSQDLRSVLTAGKRFRVNNCVFEVASITSTVITVVDDVGVGKYCTDFSGKTYGLKEVVSKPTNAITSKTATYTLTPSSVIANALQAVNTVGTVLVSHSKVITSTFVGSRYDITFKQKSGSVPLLVCSMTNLKVTSGTCPGNCRCQVTRQVIGSGIYGSFALSLVKQSDGTTAVKSADIPWDSSEATMKSILEATSNGGEFPFGTVKVTRTVYNPSSNKWSGGFTWKIEFANRGWNVPKITIDGAKLLNVNGGVKPTFVVEDASSLLTPPAGSQDGNEISGSFNLKLDSVVSSSPFVIGTDTVVGSWTTPSVADTKLKAAIIARMSNVADVTVYRSAATQAKGFTWTVTFIHRDNGGDVTDMTVPSHTLQGTNAKIVVVEKVKGNQLGGTFQLQFDGFTTGPILYSASPADVETQLNGLSSIIPSAVKVTRSGPYGPTGANSNDAKQVLSYVWSITFMSSTWADPTSDHTAGISGNWKGPAAKWDDKWPLGHSKAWGRHAGALSSKGKTIACIKDALTTTANDGSQSCTVATPSPGVSPISGTFTIKIDSTSAAYMSVKGSYTSGVIDHNAFASAADSNSNGKSVEEILEKMPNVGDVTVTRSSVDSTNGGYKWTITFVRDADGPCEQVDSFKQLCNAPGNVPRVVPIGSQLTGASPTVIGCEQGYTGDAACTANCNNVCLHGVLLRGYFSNFKVTGDPAFVKGCSSCVTKCGGGNCSPMTYLEVSANLANHLKAGDRFKVGSYNCIFKVKSIAAPVSGSRIDVDSITCAITTGTHSLNLVLPWNADALAVERSLEAYSDSTKEIGLWSGGRQVSVQRIVHDKYGAISWAIRFLSNPTQTPPGSGNIASIQATSSDFTSTVTENQAGSIGLSGTFTVDFNSAYGPRTMKFDEDEDRFTRKLVEMNTIGKVVVRKYKYPSSQTGCTTTLCAGGWDDLSVASDGTRGGYRWKVRFLKNTGSHNGFTYPPGSGNVDALAVSATNINGNGKSVDVKSSSEGSKPLLGTFSLIYDEFETPKFSYATSAESLKQGIESLKNVGRVDTTMSNLITYRVPKAVASVARDSSVVTISGITDIREFVAPGDIIRIGPVSGSKLVGSNDDTPVTGALSSSLVVVDALSPIIKAKTPFHTTVFPKQQLRIGGSLYTIARTGVEIQTITVKTDGTWSDSESRLFYKLQFKHKTTIATTAACIAFNAPASDLQTKLRALGNIGSTDVKVTRSGPKSLPSSFKGYVYTVYFEGASVFGDVAQLSVVSAGTGSCVAISKAVAETALVTNGGHVAHQQIQLFTNSGAVTDGSGYFKLTLGGNPTTSCIKWGDSASNVQAAIVGITGVSSGEVIVSREGIDEPVTEIQKLTMTSNSPVTIGIVGYFKLSFKHRGVTTSTACLHYGVSTVDLQTAVNGLNNVDTGHIYINRTGDGSASWGYGYEYTFHFSGPATGGTSDFLGDVSEFIIHDTGSGTCKPVAGGSPALRMSTTRPGKATYTYNVYFVGDKRSQVNPMAITNEGTGDCSSGWKHTNGSVRDVRINVVAIGGSAEVQKIIVKDSSASISGTPSYKIGVHSSLTAQCIAYNAPATTVRDQINGIASVGAGGVTVSKDSDPVLAPNGFVYSITFSGTTVHGDLDKMTISHAGCVTFASTSSVTVTESTKGGGSMNQFALTSSYTGESIGSQVAYLASQTFTVMDSGIEVKKIVVKDTAAVFNAAATYTLGYGVASPTTVTGVKWDSTEEEMENALSKLGSINTGDVSVSRTKDAVVAPNGYIYTIYFKGVSVKGNIGTLTASSKINFAGTGSVVASTVTDGKDVNLFSSNSLPLATLASSSTEAQYYGEGSNLGIYKVNGFLWTVKFSTNLGDIPKLSYKNESFQGTLSLYDDFIKGSLSNTFSPTNLHPGITYYLKCSASTLLGSSPFSSIVKVVASGIPSEPLNVMAGHSAHVDEMQVVSSAATHIDEVQVITTSAASIPEVQTISITANPCATSSCISGKIAVRFPTIQIITVSAKATITAGTYKVTFSRFVSSGTGTLKAHTGVSITTAIAWNADAATMKSKLEALGTISPNDIVVTRSGDGSKSSSYGYIYTVTFIGDDVSGEVQKMTVSDPTTTCGGGCTIFAVTGNVGTSNDVKTTLLNPGKVMGTDTEIQRVIVKASKPLSAGGYYLSFTHGGGTQKTSGSCIMYNAPATSVDSGGDGSSVQEKLQALSNIDIVHVTRTKNSDIALNGYVYDIFFSGNGVRGSLNLLVKSACADFKTLENNVLTTSGVNGAVVVSSINKGGYDASNTFVNAASSTAAQLKTDLELLPVIGKATVSRSLADDQGGFQWTIAFDEKEGNVNSLVCSGDSSFKAISGAKCVANTLTDGNTLSGSFIVESSSPIPFNADANTMKMSLEAMVTIGSINVIRTGPDGQGGYSWTIRFVGYKGDVPLLQTTNSLVGSGNTITVKEIVKGNFLSGSFILSYGGYNTSAIAFNAKAQGVDTSNDGSSMQEKLQALSSIGTVAVSRSQPDTEGGYSWSITFVDNKVNPGDLSLLVADSAKLFGRGAVVSVTEKTKGAFAIGNQLWVSFDPPAIDNGASIHSYDVRWDTSSNFLADAKSFSIKTASFLYQVQHILLTSPSIAWSKVHTKHVDEIQTVSVVGAQSSTFLLSFRGISLSKNIVVGTTLFSTLKADLEALASISTVNVAPSGGSVSTFVKSGETFTITFLGERGPLPLLTSSNTAVAKVTLTKAGATSFRKERVVFKCKASSGTVTFTLGSESKTVAYGVKLSQLKVDLESLKGIPTDGLTITSDGNSQSDLCVTTGEKDIYITFHRNYGNLLLKVTASTATITANTAQSIDGILYVPTSKISGTFKLQYNGKFTSSLNAESSAFDVRTALETLSSITTVGVSRDFSRQPIGGKVDVVKGQVYVSCSSGNVCNFHKCTYGAPGSLVHIGGDWYTVLSDLTSSALPSARLYIGDLNNNPIGYLGETMNQAIVYEWAKGYDWTVVMHSTSSPLSLIQPNIPHLMPSGSIVRITGKSCSKCYYIPSQTTSMLTMGTKYYVKVNAHNINGKDSGSSLATAIPRQVPSAPTNIDLVVVSGKELEIFFSPPSLASSNVNPTYNTDITEYIVQWDLSSDFKHGLALCLSCVTSLSGNDIQVSGKDLTSLLSASTKFTVGPSACVYTATTVTSTKITVTGSHGCGTYSGRKYPLKLYTIPPIKMSGLVIQGTPPYRYLITNLVGSKVYYVRLAARNSVATQIIDAGSLIDNTKWSPTVQGTPKDQVPDAPKSVMLSVRSGTSIEVHISPPSRDGKGTSGSAITHYVIDVDTVSSFDSSNKVKAVEVAVGSLPYLFSGGPRVYYINSLLEGKIYYVQVKAKNSIGLSRSVLASNPLAPIRPPDAPVEVKVSTLTSQTTPITTATVSWKRPTASNGNGGLGLSHYKVEWWTSKIRSEVQVVELKWSTAPSGKFTLSFGGISSGAIAYDGSPQDIRNALMNIGGHASDPSQQGSIKIGQIDVTRTSINADKGYHWSITFLDTGSGQKNDGDQPMLQMSIASVTGGSGVTNRVYEAFSGVSAASSTIPGKKEVQVIVSSHSSTAVSGYFRVSFKGSPWSSYLSSTISTSDMKKALENLSTIGKVTVSMGTATNGKYWKVTFDTDVGNQPILVVDKTYLLPADSTLHVKDGDNIVKSDGVKCLPGLSGCPGSPTWAGFSTGVADMAVIGETAVGYGFFETSDSNTFTYNIPNLKPGVPYYVSVSVKNSLGYGPRALSFPSPIIPPKQVPESPRNASLGVNFGDSTHLKSKWALPSSDGGDSILKYRVEYDTSANFDSPAKEEFWCPNAPTYAVWQITSSRTSGTAAIGNGFFKLKLTRKSAIHTTEPIPWNAVAMSSEELGGQPAVSKVFCTSCPTCADICDSSSTYPFKRREKSGSMQSKLQYLGVLSNVKVSRSIMAADGGYVWSITFLDVGDDFSFEATSTLSSITCSNNVCGGSTYAVKAVKLTSGINYGACTGTKVIPSSGVLIKGKMYYMRVFAFNSIGYSIAANSGSPEKPMVVPGLATGVSLQVASVSELRVIFSPPDDNGGDTVTEYLVEWATNSGFTSPSNSTVNLLSGGAPFYKTIGGLKKGTYYFTRVRAKNSQGYGLPQLSSPTSLNPHTTPSSPTNVKLGVTSSSMLTVRWNVPADNGGDALTGYIIEWDTVVGFNSLESSPQKGTHTAVTSQRSYTISSLTSARIYYVRIFARNSKGPGTSQTSSPPFAKTSNMVPGKPHTLIAAATSVSAQLLITWQPPQIPHHGIPCAGTLLSPTTCGVANGFNAAFGGSTISYEVEWKVDSNFDGTKTKSTTASSLTLTSADGLLAGTKYYVRVLAKNDKGQGTYCKRLNSGGYLCPDGLVLLSGGVVTGQFVSATTKA